MRTILLGVILPAAAFCQSAAAPPAFDIADVHLSPRADWAKTVDNWKQGGTLAGDRYQLRRATMVDLIRAAYNINLHDEVYGGPSWLDYDRFEVVAKTKPGTRPATLRLMLQNLLAERFHLVLKMDMHPVPGYVLSTGKGSLNFKPATGDAGSTGCQNAGGISYADFQCRNITMADFAEFLRGPVRGPVLDSTGLDGVWDIDLKYPIASIGAWFPGMEALEKLGLKLEAGKVPQPVLTVESVNELPSANPPGVAAALPPVTPEFEVASIRPCADNTSVAAHFQPGGRVVATCQPPSYMVMEAWRLHSMDPPGMPKSISGWTVPNVTIVAKAPAGVSPDRDSLNLLMRALLIDRFKLAFHYEDRPMDTYTLVAVKPKLTKANPANRTGCARQNDIHPGQGSIVHLDCRNMTMAQLAEQIPAYKTDVHYPIVDATGIDGAFDFTIDYNTFSSHSGGGRGQDASANGAAGEAPDPSGSVPFDDAIQKQLGLKLEVHKHPQPVFVIDHMEEKPTDN